MPDKKLNEVEKLEQPHKPSPANPHIDTFVQNVQEVFYVISCHDCSHPFAVNETLYEKAQQRSGKYMYCPNCGAQTYGRDRDHLVESVDYKTRKIEEA